MMVDHVYLVHADCTSRYFNLYLCISPTQGQLTWNGDLNYRDRDTVERKQTGPNLSGSQGIPGQFAAY